VGHVSVLNRCSNRTVTIRCDRTYRSQRTLRNQRDASP